MEPFVAALLVEVMTTWPEASDLLSALEVTHTHHTTLVISVCFEMVSGRQSVDLCWSCHGDGGWGYQWEVYQEVLGEPLMASFQESFNIVCFST
jgi:hypothetical protein